MNPTQQRLDDLIIVDPNFADYNRFITALGLQEVHVSRFSSGEYALRATGAGASALWLVNVRLPDMSGTNFLKMVRRRLRRCRIFLVADDYSVEDELAARLAGATAYVCKPVSATWLDGYAPRCPSPAIRGPTSVAAFPV